MVDWWLRRATFVSLRVETLRVRVELRDPLILLTVDYCFASSPDRAKPALFTIPEKVLLRGAEWRDAADDREPAEVVAGSGRMLVVPARGRSWGGRTLRMHLEMRRRDAGDVLGFPQGLPQPLVEDACGPLPRVVLHESPGVREMVTGGIADDPSRDVRSQPALQLILRFAGAAKRDSRLPLSLDRKLLGASTTAQAAEAHQLLVRILRFHASVFGLQPRAEPMVFLAGVGLRSAGAVLALNSPDALGLGPQGAPEHIMLASRLGRIWWGGGCRIAGPHAREVEAGIRGAAGMLWGDGVQSAWRATLLDEWRRLESAPAPPFRLRRRAPAFRHDIQARISLRLYEQWRTDERARARIRTLTAAAWGRVVSESHVSDALFGGDRRGYGQRSEAD